jgi:hypothetical protein
MVPIPLPLGTAEATPKEYHPRGWPFRSASLQRLNNLKKLLGRDYNAALRDIEEHLDTAILKWEMRANDKKGQPNSA